MPFSYKKNQSVYIPVTNSDWGNYEIDIYTVAMKLVYSNSNSLSNTNRFHKKLVTWNGFDNSGNKLASGVYIYAIKTKSETKTGKLVIVNE